MKRIILVFLMFAGAYQLRAQQLLPVKPADSLSNKLLDSYLKATSNNPWQPLLNVNGASTAINSKGFGTGSAIDHMPVAVLEGQSKMPVVKLGGYYTMPVKRPGSGDQLSLFQKTFPGLPVFKNPGQ